MQRRPVRTKTRGTISSSPRTIWTLTTTIWGWWRRTGDLELLSPIPQLGRRDGAWASPNAVLNGETIEVAGGHEV